MDPAEKALDTLVVGAGPAGIGIGLALAAIDGLTFGIVDRGGVGQTFLEWQEEQRFLTPSFTGNGFGATDLNAVHPETSPAHALGVDYPTGREYARYLRGVAAHFELPILTETAVTEVSRRDDVFKVTTTRGPVLAETLIWAGGEYHHPLAPRVSSSSLADHVRDRQAWDRRDGRLVVIGGYESGIDVACHHVERGSHVTIVDRHAPWDVRQGSDPSFRLAPRSRQRLHAAATTGQLALSAAHASAIKRAGDGFLVRLDDGSSVHADARPIAANGFGPGLGPVEHLFAQREDGWPELDDDDESTRTPGLFLTGPSVRHGGLRFCFIYKFRQRFAHVARVIGDRAGLDTRALEAWRAAGMLTDDLSCCAVECAC